MTDALEITRHHVGDERVDRLRIAPIDQCGRGGASRIYDITTDGHLVERLKFQRGPVCEVGVNGITNETLLAIVADRLQGFQRGPMACRENALSLTKIEEALHWMQTRTRRRLAAGVQGRGKP